MFGALFGISLIVTTVQLIKEANMKPIPAENWENKELYYKDLSSLPIEQVMKNVENGKYKLEVKYPKPHRDSNGKIIIENCKLFDEDMVKYGAVQTYKWVEQGKYNLDGEALEKEKKRIQEEYEKRFYR